MSSVKKWTSPLCPARKAHALKTARQITETISESIFWDNKSCIATNSFRGLNPISLAVLFFAHAEHFPNTSFRYRSHQLMQVAVNHGVQGAHAGLFGGLSELGLSADLLSESLHYQKLLAWTDKRIAMLSKSMGERIERSVASDSLKFSHYDVVSGLSGVLRYMLQRNRTLSRGDLHYALKALSRPIDRYGVISFSVKSDNIEGYLAQKVDSAERLINCGFAHGVAGILAVLSLAWEVGYDFRSLRGAVQKLTEYLIEFCQKDDFGIGWPDAHSYPTSMPAKVTFDAWCYGSAGVSRAVWLSGSACRKNSYKDFAISAIQCAIGRELSLRGLQTPWLCHGLAGLLLILVRFYNECPDNLIAEGMEKVFDRIFEHYQEATLLGFADSGQVGYQINDISLLNGAVGVALVLYSISSDLEPRWDRLLALS